MRIQNHVTFCGTIERNGVMTDVYDTASGNRLVSGVYPERENLSEESLTDILNDPRTKIFDWRE